MAAAPLLAQLNKAMVSKMRAQHRLTSVCAERDSAIEEVRNRKVELVLEQLNSRDEALKGLIEREDMAREEIHHLKVSVNNPDRPLKTGFLEKQSDLLKQFAMRRVVLTSAGIFSFRTGKDAPADTDNLGDASVQLIFDAKGASLRSVGERTFEIASGGRSLVFQGATSQEVSEWMQAISQTIGAVVTGLGVDAVAALATRVPSTTTLSVVLAEFAMGGHPAGPKRDESFRLALLPALEGIEEKGVVVKAVVHK